MGQAGQTIERGLLRLELAGMTVTLVGRVRCETAKWVARELDERR